MPGKRGSEACGAAIPGAISPNLVHRQTSGTGELVDDGAERAAEAFGKAPDRDVAAEHHAVRLGTRAYAGGQDSVIRVEQDHGIEQIGPARERASPPARGRVRAAIGEGKVEPAD